LKFGADFAGRLRRRRPQPGDTWHLDEVFIRIRGALHYLWRAVDQHGVVLDILVQNRRNGAAAKRFFNHLLRGLQYKPRRLIADGLRSYGVAINHSVWLYHVFSLSLRDVELIHDLGGKPMARVGG
jgi:putative transposase